VITGLAGIGSIEALSGPFLSEKKVRIGIVGGRFGATFQFHEHQSSLKGGELLTIPDFDD
jgi:hypothetical protein